MKKLRDVETALANFFASGVLRLEEKLGPILWQFPPNFGWNEQRFRDFFALLPRDTTEAEKLARRHDAKLDGRAWTKTKRTRPVRHCVEIRHSSFLNPTFFQLLRRYHIAFVFADTAGKWPFAEELTADFVYCRLHGDSELYVSGYSDPAIEQWAQRLEKWRLPQPKRKTPRDIYVYFDNDAKVHAPFDAKRLAGRLGVVWDQVVPTPTRR